MNTRFLRNTVLGVCLGLPGVLSAFAQSTYEPYTFTTIAGKAQSAGSTNGTNSAARFGWPGAVTVDSAGNLYVAEHNNKSIRRITPMGTSWVVTTLVGKAGMSGNADGTNGAARFGGPVGLVLDGACNLYVVDEGNSTIRKVAPVGTNWVVTTLAGKAGSAGSADGTNGAARFNVPWGIALDSAGNLYVADVIDSTIRKVAPVGTNWVVTTLAGKAGEVGSTDGTNSAARFNGPLGVAVDSAGSVYVADGALAWMRGVATFNYTIRKMTPVGTDWVVTTLAGKAENAGSADGTNSAARFNCPGQVAVDGAGNLYVEDWGNDAIRKVTPVGTNWVVTTLAGKAGSSGAADGAGSTARFCFYDPINGAAGGLAVDSAGNLYVADVFNDTIRKGCRPLEIVSSEPSYGMSNGPFGFALTGPAGQPVVVDASTDLGNWLPIWTNIFMVGPLQFSDPADVSSHRFYRAHRP